MPIEKEKDRMNYVVENAPDFTLGILENVNPTFTCGAIKCGVMTVTEGCRIKASCSEGISCGSIGK